MTLQLLMAVKIHNNKITNSIDILGFISVEMITDIFGRVYILLPRHHSIYYVEEKKPSPIFSTNRQTYSIVYVAHDKL